MIPFEECHDWDDRITYCHACGGRPGGDCLYKYEPEEDP